MGSEIRAQVFDIQRFSVHDGPGIRTTVFFKGCPLRCEWCQNPESQDSAPQLMLYPDLWMCCGACAEACPEAPSQHSLGHASPPTPGPASQPALGPVSRPCPSLRSLGPASPPTLGPVSRPRPCRVCGRCVDVCPTGARRIVGEQKTVGEILALALRDKPYYGARGGVTLSGGEPLAQWPAARALADRLRAEGVHVAIDTSCLASRAVIDDVPECFDLVLADLKLVSSESHLLWTGVDNAGILAAIRAWSAAMPGRLWISVPVIPGVQDNAEFKRMAAFCAALPNTPPVRLIPYHRLADTKYVALGHAAPIFPGAVVERRDAARAILHQKGIHILEQ